MSGITLQRLGEIAKYELGAEPENPAELRELARYAGEHLMGAREWQWAEGREVRLRPREQIELELATWTEATKTLTLTGAFTDYDHLSADTIEIEDGTGATPGTYEVASRTSANAIVLTTSIGAAADGQTDIEALMPNDQIALPSDFTFQGVTAYAMTDGLVGQLSMVSPTDMLRFRSMGSIGSTVGFWALLRHVRSNAGGRPVPRLELYPASDDASEALVIYYRAGWLEPATDDEVLSLPTWLDTLYLEMFKAVVMGNEEPENGTVDQRLTALRQGVLWLDAVRFDATLQRDFGPTTGGWLDCAPTGFSRYSVPPPIIPT